jgi:hypothetical protein
MLKPTIFYYFFFMLFCSSMLSQEESEMKTFVGEMKKKSQAHKDAINFRKAQSFFLTKEWDSTLFYSMKQLDAAPVAELDDYCHFFRGVSFKKKSFLTEPRKSSI